MKKEWTFYMTKKSVCAIERARETSLRASIKRRWKKVLQSVASRFFFFSLSLCYPSSFKALCGGSRTKVTSASYQTETGKENISHTIRFNKFFLFICYRNTLFVAFLNCLLRFFPPTEFGPFRSCASCMRARDHHFATANENSRLQDR